MSDGPKPHVGGPVALGCPTVLIGGLPAARVGDTAVCVGPPDTIAAGCASVLIGGKPAARMGDSTVHGGKIVIGCATVLIGDGGGGGAGAAPAAAGATTKAPSAKPEHRPNPAHDPRSPHFNPRKTPEPPDSAEVYARAIEGDDGKWYGVGESGEIYRFASDNAGGAHFNGKTGGAEGIPPDRIPRNVKRSLRKKG